MNLRFIIYLLIILTAFIIGMVRFKRLAIPFKFLAVLVGLSFLSELGTRVMAYQTGSSMPIYHVICVVHFVLFSLIYHCLLETKVIKTAALWLMLPFIGFAIFNLLKLQPITSFPSNSILISQALYIVYALALFLQMLTRPVLIPLSRQSMFWFNISVLVFSSVLLFNLGLINYFHKRDMDTSLLDAIIYAVSLTFYTLFGVALYLDNRIQTHTH
jgi:hypothetical protein